MQHGIIATNLLLKFLKTTWKE